MKDKMFGGTPNMARRRHALPISSRISPQPAGQILRNRFEWFVRFQLNPLQIFLGTEPSPLPLGELPRVCYSLRMTETLTIRLPKSLGAGLSRQNARGQDQPHRHSAPGCG